MLKHGLSIAAAITLALAIFSIIRMQPMTAKSAPPVAPPSPPTSAKSIGAVGLVESRSENVAISVPVPGLIMHIYVSAGERVHRGAKLFSLDDRDLQAELALRHSTLEVAKARLERLRQSPRKEEIPPVEAKVREAQVALEDAQVQLNVIEKVKDRRAIREEDLLRRRLTVNAAQSRLEQAQAELALLKAGAWQPDVEVARSQIAEAQSQVARVEADLQRLVITAPIDGEILQCKAHVGEYAASGTLAQPLILLGDTSQLYVRADVDEEDAWRVRSGAAATGSLRGNSQQSLALRFVRAEPYVIPKKNLTGDNTERVDTRVLQVIFALPGGARAHPGQQMDVFISEGQRGR